VIGATVSHYRVLEKLGEGGIGEVYKAHDTRLDRAVAINVLPVALAGDPDRRRRFEQEARAIAALSHPHICTLFDIGHRCSRASGAPPGSAISYNRRARSSAPSRSDDGSLAWHAAVPQTCGC